MVDWETKLSADLCDFFYGATRQVLVDPVDVSIELDKWAAWADEWHSECTKAEKMTRQTAPSVDRGGEHSGPNLTRGQTHMPIAEL